MQFSFLPTAPHHCRCTPGVLSPFLTSLVSSRMPIEWGPACSSRTMCWSRSRSLVMIPVVLAEELLQGPGRHAGVDRDRLDALLGDVGELPGDVHRQVGAGVLAREAVVEPLEKLPKLGLELPDLLHVHAGPSVNLGGEHRFDMPGVSSHHNLACCSTR